MSPSLLSNTRKPSRGRATKNWFDSEDEADDTKSLPSTDVTLSGKDEEEGVAYPPDGQFGHLRTTAQVSTDPGALPPWSHGVSVTRQVIVETSAAVPR
jgi:hypothetical protein